uniref:KH-like RNA-binding domain-containing protein n=1 Tax=Canis lupus dingo TaxID=286419 RepID=A0A8C0L1X0_CANLU
LFCTVTSAPLLPDQVIILKMERMSQVPLIVDILNSGDFAEITIFSQPYIQNQVKSIPPSLAWWHQEHCTGDMEKQAPCREPNVGLDPGSPGSHPRPQAAPNRCATRAAPAFRSLRK